MTNQCNRLKFPELRLSHAVDVQIRFSDYDSFGHINNNSYMSFFDLGKSDFLCRAMGRVCSPAELSAAIVNIDVDFLAPTPVGEPLAVQTAPVHLGERSFSLYQRIVNPLTGTVKAQAVSTLAGFVIATQSGAPLRKDLRDAIAACIL